ncbi:MAG: symmetrical bis(5'-nucleosyl)-tetraphosphatase [Thiotrichales bacterium]|jgi:bis(5'-nucleosyl)-tetraphosphatase (symmetrical)|nr:symmetrical bis(5'-nucleosyl)-tetraphosphatase [Thiotrichales bacterium]MBT6810359.1 symmetrical bis(5'-nucleosyl)-tetraphosphatase [Thiotrichales bacterium]
MNHKREKKISHSPHNSGILPAVYAVGDIQGCLDDLLRLLEKVKFNPSSDKIWFVGDLVNRGPKSLETLQFIRSLGDSAVSVLGNHDLHLLALTEGDKRYSSKFDTLLPILESEQRDELFHWLRHRPLLHHDKKLGYAMIHAGLPPQWSLKQAKRRAHELESVLRGDNYRDFLRNMYGNQPDRWSGKLEGVDRLRFITNCFTRLRFCSEDGTLDLKTKGKMGSQPEGDLPWFQVPNRKSEKHRIIFGHWSTLNIKTKNNAYPIDHGCLWGGKLTALQINCEPPKWHSVDCSESLVPF